MTGLDYPGLRDFQPLRKAGPRCGPLQSGVSGRPAPSQGGL